MTVVYMVNIFLIASQRAVTEVESPMLSFVHSDDIYAHAEVIIHFTTSSTLIVISRIPRKFVENAR